MVMIMGRRGVVRRFGCGRHWMVLSDAVMSVVRTYIAKSACIWGMAKSVIRRVLVADQDCLNLAFSFYPHGAMQYAIPSRVGKPSNRTHDAALQHLSMLPSSPPHLNLPIDPTPKQCYRAPISPFCRPRRFFRASILAHYLTSAASSTRRRVHVHERVLLPSFLPSFLPSILSAHWRILLLVTSWRRLRWWIPEAPSSLPFPHSSFFFSSNHAARLDTAAGLGSRLLRWLTSIGTNSCFRPCSCS